MGSFEDDVATSFFYNFENGLENLAAMDSIEL